MRWIHLAPDTGLQESRKACVEQKATSEHRAETVLTDRALPINQTMLLSKEILVGESELS